MLSTDRSTHTVLISTPLNALLENRLETMTVTRTKGAESNVNSEVLFLSCVSMLLRIFRAWTCCIS